MLFSVRSSAPISVTGHSLLLPVEAAVGRGFRTLDFHSDSFVFGSVLDTLSAFPLSRFAGPLFEELRHPIRRPNQTPQRTVLCCSRRFQQVPDILPCSSYPTPSALEQFSHVFHLEKPTSFIPSILRVIPTLDRI